MKMDRADDMFEPYDDGMMDYAYDFSEEEKDVDYHDDPDSYDDPEQEDAANSHGAAFRL